MRVRGPHADDFDDWNDMRGTIIHGHADGIDLPFGLTDDEAEALAAEHRAILARKKPLGFTAWTDDAAL